MNQAAVEAYAAGAGKLAAAITGLEKSDFLAYPLPGTWSISEIVIHLMDSDLVASDRMKRIIAEENPPLIGYDETAFAKSLSYDKQDPFKAAEVFRLNRELTAVVLRNVTASTFDRAGVHSEKGRLTLGHMVQMYVDHLEHHLVYVHKKRQLLGKGV